MDSPADLSPNASPRRVLGNAPTTHPSSIPSSPVRDTSNNGSIDSTGFEKVERPSEDVLEAYSQQFASQMQQSIFGQLPEDPDFAQLAGFEVVDRMGPAPSHTMDAQPPNVNGRQNRDEEDVDVLVRIPGDIDDPNQPMMSSSRPHDDVLEKTYGGDHPEGLIDIPKNEPEPHRPDVDLLGDYNDHPPQLPHEHQHQHPEPPRDDFADLLAPASGEIGHVAIEQQRSHIDDFDFDQPLEPKKEEPKKDEKEDIFEQLKRELQDDIPEETIREHVEDVHDDIDAIMNRMKDTQHDEHHPESPSADSGRDTVGKLLGEEDDGPHFGRQTPEEQMIEREGPLTIPELPETLPEDEDDYEIPRVPSGGPGTPHHGFETEPRPPTPPKDISDEDVKPTVMNLGPAPYHHHVGKQHSILKHPENAPWFDFKTVDPRLLDLIYWRDPKKSAIALSLTLLALFILAKYPLLAVISYSSLLVLAGTLGFRIFKAVEAQVKKTEQQNPFQPLLEHELSLPQEKVHEQVDVLVEHGQLLANQTRRLFLVESIVDSVKFGILLWALTYVSSWFSGFGLVILTVLGIFSVPKFYEVYQEPIDAQLAVIKGHIDNVSHLLEEKLPFLKRAKVETEKKDQ